MNKITKNPFSLTLITSAIFNIAILAVYLTTAYILKSEIAIYAFHFISEILKATLPLFIACGLAEIYKEKGLRNALLLTVIFALIPLLEVIPRLVISLSGSDFWDAMLIILLESVLAIAIAYFKYALLLLLIIFIRRKFAKQEEEENLTTLNLKNLFDFSNLTIFSIFSAAGAIFIYNMIFEIIDTVDYLIRYQGSYRIDEIIYIAVSYIVILASLFISHAFSVLFAARTRENQ